MPGMDGHTLVGLVRQELPAIKVILMSGYTEDVYRDEIGRDATLHFLGKSSGQQNGRLWGLISKVPEKIILQKEVHEM